MPAIPENKFTELVAAYRKDMPEGGLKSSFISKEDIHEMLHGDVTGIRIFLAKDEQGVLTLVAKPEHHEHHTDAKAFAQVPAFRFIDCPPICPKSADQGV